MQAIIRYFTGTGNTARVMAMVADELQTKDWVIDSQESWLAGPAKATPRGDLLLLGHPALGTGAPVHFLKWLQHLPAGNGIPAAIISVCGATVAKHRIVDGNSLYSSVQISRILRHKGYRILAAQDVSLPVNWTQLINPPSSSQIQQIFANSEPQIRQIGQELARFHGTIKARGWTTKILGALMAGLYHTIGRRFLGKIFVADQNCTDCGLCARSCPAGAIRMKQHKPNWNLDCSSCNRCINICPQKAIQCSAPVLLIQLGLNFTALAMALVFADWPARVLNLLAPGWQSLVETQKGPIAVIISLLIPTLGFCLFFGVACLLQLGPIAALLQGFSHSRFGARILGISWTRGFRRYLAPGFIYRK